MRYSYTSQNFCLEIKLPGNGFKKKITPLPLLLIIFALAGATSNVTRLLRNLIIEPGYDLCNKSGQMLNSRGKERKIKRRKITFAGWISVNHQVTASSRNPISRPVRFPHKYAHACSVALILAFTYAAQEAWREKDV